MKPLLKRVICYVLVMLCAGSVIAETDYWQVIKKFLLESTGGENKQFREYMESLTAEELLIAAKQCSMEMESSVSPEDWDVATGNLGFFYQYYPLKTDDLEDISPLLNNLKDKSQSIYWRRYIMHILGGSWSGKPSGEQSLAAAKIMYEIYSNDSESSLLKPKAIRSSTRLLRYAYSVNLRNDPNVKQFTKQQRMRTRELVNAIRANNIKLSQQTIKANEKVLSEINKSIAAQLNLFSNQQVDNSLKTEIIVVWARYHEYDLDSPEVSQTLANAVNNYKQYNEKVWHILLKTNIEVFDNQNATTKLQDIINNVQDETVKKHLIRLNKKLNKDNSTKSHKNGDS